MTSLLPLAACATEVPLKPAADANNPLCAHVTVRLPGNIGEHKKRATNAQATGAWGEPAIVILRCGLKVSEPTTAACINVNGVDWIVDNTDAPRYRFEAYGRNPGLEIFVDADAISGTDALLELSPAVQQLPQERKCSAVNDTLSSNEIKLEN